MQTSQSSGTARAARLILIVHGDVELGVDLARAKLHSVDQAAHRAALVMPDPKPHRPRLNHERTKIYELDRSGLSQLVPGHEPKRHLIDNAFRQAQRVLAASVDHAEVRADPRRLSAQIILGLFAESGWRIEVCSADRNPRDHGGSQAGPP